MKKILLLLLLLFFTCIYSQERVNNISPKINTNTVSSLLKATGYKKNTMGKWVSKPNRIPYVLDPQFESLSNNGLYSLGYNRENFVKYEIRKININNVIYNVLIKHYKDGYYEYPSIREGWSYTKSFDFIVFDDNEKEKLKLIKKDSINNIEIKPLFYGKIEYLDNYKLSYIEDKILELKNENANYAGLYENTFDSDVKFYFNFLNYKDVTRFKFGEYDFDLKDEYYETDINIFNSFINIK